ncbi:MAG: FAA hydrolase family protein [Puniceicoccaceae bacterium]|nr:MAG: FAA hydrolase family protein [Puniceicoccaceae bacterium]
MKLIRFGKSGEEKPGLIGPGGERLDCSGWFGDWDRAFFAAGGPAALAKRLAAERGQLPRVAEEERWGAPVARPGKLIGIGLNYSDHAREAGMAVPEEPIVFLKATNTVVGPYDDVLIPRGSEKTDWEVELGVVVGREARYVESVEAARGFIAGYCISNDVSERAFQLERGGQWTKGKSCDTFNPLGPWLATVDEVPAAEALGMSLTVNGEVRQNGSTATMIFKPDHLVWYLSQFMTLEPGDVITTGTPPGVGMGMKPPRFLRTGDVMELAIDGLGRQRQVCRNA